MGMAPDEVEKTVARVRSRSRDASASRQGRKRERSVSASGVRDEEEHLSEKKKAKRSKSRAASISATPKPGSGYKDFKDVQKAQQINLRLVKARRTLAKQGESDRTIPDLKPKHLNTGKRGIGKNQRR